MSHSSHNNFKSTFNSYVTVLTFESRIISFNIQTTCPKFKYKFNFTKLWNSETGFGKICYHKLYIN
jgi:hypothetical protein